MGLDMNLMKRVRTNKDSADEVLVYWRKANAVHNFFTKGKEYKSCDSIEVTKDMLGDLLDRCAEVLANRDRASELLPTTDGFFFGSTEYDDWYFNKLKNTIQEIIPILSDGDIKDGDLYYFGWY